MADEYIRKAEAIEAVDFGITLASAINLETGEWSELFKRENDELRKAIERIQKIELADVVPYSISDDGTMTITVPKGMAVGRVFVQRR